jgi:hypothetical protein
MDARRAATGLARLGSALHGGGEGGSRAPGFGQAAFLRPCRAPCGANRRAIQAFVFEQPGGRGQVLLAFPDPAAPGESGQKDLVDALVERRKLQPLIEVRKRFLVGNVPGEMLQQGGVAAAESPSLRSEPTVENRAAGDLQALEEISGEQRSERPLPLWRERLYPLFDCAGDLDRIDEAIRQVEPDGIIAGMDAPAVLLVDEGPDLAQAPAKLAARIIGHVP